MLKIAIYHNLPSGGGLYHLAQVAEEMSKRGHRVHLFTPQTAEQNFTQLNDCVAKHTVLPRHPWRPSSSALNPIRYRQYLNHCSTQEIHWAQEIQSGAFDLIYTGQCQTWTEPPLLRHLASSTTKVHFCQEPKRSFHEERFLKQRKNWPLWKKCWRLPTIRWMQNEMQSNIEAADHVLCNSKFSQSRIQSAYPTITPAIHYIGVDTKTFSPCYKSNTKAQIITVGALDPSKNHDFAIDVASKRPAQQALKVVVITDRSYGDTAEQLKAKAKQLKVELEIRVRVSTAELVQLYRQSLATVYSPIEEPFGIVSIESQACGTPILGANEGGLKETIEDDVGGHLCERDPDVFAQHLERWLHCPEVRQKLSEQARQHALDKWCKRKLIASTVQRIEGLL